MLLRSLRSKILLVLLGAALIAAASGAALTLGIKRADRLIDRSHLSQSQLELLLLLASRVNDFGLAAVEAARVPQARRPSIAGAATEVSAVFDLIEASIDKQVLVLTSDAQRRTEASEGLGIARMRAQFQKLNQQLATVLEQNADPEEQQGRVRALMDLFGMDFSPNLQRAIEHERREVQDGWSAITGLKSNLVIVAAALATGALLVAALLYLGPTRSVLRRLKQTAEGAEAIASGRFDTRLRQEGRDELSALMTGFNRMAENLSEREQRLVAGQRDLQRTIDARTAELREANRRLEEIDANRRRFFADISHELRTPLTVILGEAELLLRQGDKLPEGCRASLETVQNRARRLNRRIDDMLRVARSESGRLELSLTQAEAGEIVTDAVEDTLAIARRSGIEVKLERGPGNLYVQGDRDWLRQVCSGLIANAIRYSGHPGFIEVKARGENGAAIMEVSDQGQGIPPEEQRLVFDRFFKGRDSEVSSGTGHGVGLALAKWIIDEHHGHIELMSPGLLADGNGSPGTTVIVRLSLSGEQEVGG